MKEVEQAVNEGEMWKIVNKGKKKRKRIEEGIKEDDWKAHFMRLLGGVKHRIKIEDGAGREGEKKNKQGKK